MGIGIAIPEDSVIDGSIDFSGCTISNTAYEGLAVWHRPDAVIDMSFTDCDWIDVGQAGTSNVGSGFMNCGDPNCITVPDAIDFSNCFIYGRDAVNPSLIPVDLESSSGVTIVP